MKVVGYIILIYSVNNLCITFLSSNLTLKG